MVKLLYILFMLILSGTVFAKNLGVFGAVWPIKERSMLVLLKEKAKKANISQYHRRFEARAKAYADRPTGVKLPAANRHTVHYYAPVVTVTKDVIDNSGKVIVTAGTSVNALNRIPAYSPHLVFIDGENQKQRSFAKNELIRFPNSKIILTAGSIKETVDYLKHIVFFDQRGFLTTKFRIKRLPAVITRSDMSLRIDEVTV